MFILIFNQLLKMLLLMLVGVFCARKNLITEEGNRCISNFLLMIVNPCLIISVYQVDFDSRLAKGLLLSLVAAVIAHILAFIISGVLIRPDGNPEYTLDRYAAAYSNCGFIGIPLINSVLGSEGVFYLTAFMTVFNILSWTHGLSLIKGKFEARHIKEGLMAPMVLGAFVAIFLFFTQIHIPSVIMDSMDYIAATNTPLAMAVAGFSVAQSDIRKLFTNLHFYWVALIKLFLVPFVAILMVRFLNFPEMVAYTIIIAAACPTATTITMMCIRFNRNYRYSSEIFSFTTVLSMITIPLVMLVAGAIL